MPMSVNHVLSEIRGLLPDKDAVRRLVWSQGGPIDPVVEDYLEAYNVDLGQIVEHVHDNGAPKLFGFRFDCEEVGLWRRWHPNGRLAEVTKPEGDLRVSRTWDKTGRPIDTECLDHKGSSLPPDESEDPAVTVEEEDIARTWLAKHGLPWGPEDAWFQIQRLGESHGDWWDKARHAPIPPMAIQWLIDHEDSRYIQRSALIKAFAWAVGLAAGFESLFALERVNLDNEFDGLEALCEAIAQGRLTLDADLPKYGGDDPGWADAKSWDEERLLVGKTSEEVMIIGRGEYALVQGSQWDACHGVLGVASSEDWMVF